MVMKLRYSTLNKSMQKGLNYVENKLQSAALRHSGHSRNSVAKPAEDIVQILRYMTAKRSRKS